MLHNFDEHDRGSLSALADKALVLIPIGATEQHGPHLPVGTDSMIVANIALGVAKRLAPSIPTLITPTMAIGYSAYHRPQGAVISLSLRTAIDVLVEVLSSLADCGFRRLFVLNGHGGNAELVSIASRIFAEGHEHVLVGAGSYWRMAQDQLTTLDDSEATRIPGHAGRFETSIMMALRPDLVADPPTGEATQAEAQLDRAPKFHADNRVLWRRRWPNGFTDDPESQTSEAGTAFLEAAINGTAESLRQFCSQMPDTDPITH